MRAPAGPRKRLRCSAAQSAHELRYNSACWQDRRTLARSLARRHSNCMHRCRLTAQRLYAAARRSLLAAPFVHPFAHLRDRQTRLASTLALALTRAKTARTNAFAIACSYGRTLYTRRHSIEFANWISLRAIEIGS